jgi:hypothetical protein
VYLYQVHRLAIDTVRDVVIRNTPDRLAAADPATPHVEPDAPGKAYPVHPTGTYLSPDPLAIGRA